MKKLLLLNFLVPFIALTQICDPNGNVVLYSNYDGGQLVIDVDEDIPDLKIGVVSYEGVEVVFTGAYTSNITGIIVAGFGGTNDPCNEGVTGNSIINYPGGSLLVTNSPSATLSNPNGNGNIICAYSCDVNSSQGGCNTVDQIEDYMLTEFGSGSIRSHSVQYGCWTSTQLVSDGGNCCLTSVTNPISISLDGIDPSCFGECDGEISSTISGGDGSYSYSWTGSSETTADLNAICAGQYILTVTDGNGDQESETIVLNDPLEIDVNVSIVDPIACNGELATLYVTATDGVSPYTGVGNQTLPAGTHTLIVEDNNGCEAEEEITIQEPDELVATSNTSNDDGDCNGSVSLSISGGDSPYSVDWGANANNQTGQFATDLCHDIYCATVTDANGCEIEVCDTVNSSLSISQNFNENENSFTIYPNPSGKNANLMIEIKRKETVLIEVYDNQGRLHSTQEVVLQGEKTKVELEANESGHFLVHIIGEDFIKTKQWIVGN